jgi:hypothetical protein
MWNLPKEITTILIMIQFILIITYIYYYISYLGSHYSSFKHYQNYSTDIGELSGFILIIFYLERIALLGWLIYEIIFNLI